ncbi:penicillin-binding transpeptidase domain-containing protein [Streptomyces sp. NBC_01445]|uniref:penicillin-binding transpeptidase domain-containing protein n=1 Tax=Streptomyces sp. NBC_01445 TaxID=2903869 RepID=UPI002DDBCF5A|nr:penicillin-binding transpeptidase domain-containing protein [Streptomyces sp. NBC_01445]WSE06712.1 penicillin-binding transpeptidase domain-containing protein [Streptomyces sp. NBC_01445]
MGSRGRQPERKKANAAVIGGVVAVVVLGAGVSAYALFSGDSDRTTAADDKPRIKTGPVTAAEVRTAADRFLTAWAAGDTAKAAAATDDATAATAALTSYGKDAHLSGVKLTPGKRAGAKMPFAVSATVAYGGKSKPFAYGSELTVVRRVKDGKPLVGWQASVVHPDLKDGDRLVTGAAGDPPIKATDRSGNELTAAEYPSLGTVIDGLREKYGKKAGGTAGIELRVVHKDSGKESEHTPDKTLVTLSKGTPGTLRTTISPTSQAVAERQVAKREKAAVVVIKPSTGEILAVANSRPEGFNTALQGSLAPGSTMKIVTSSMLLEKNLAGVDKKHPCPKYVTYGGWKFQNDDKFEIKDGTFRASFARSCNTAFISQAKELEDGDLTKQAQEVFGLGRDNWSIGVPSFDGAVPVQSQAQMAASLIGQGGVRMNPLNMASVVATAKTGEFKQPYLVSPEFDHRTLATASRKLSPSTVSALRDLLHYTAVAGTAVEPMSGLGTDMGAKTGSAEVDGQKEPNGWFTAWRGDLASAAVVQQGGHGGDSAGPVVRQMLLAGD